jgi:hypothetical protein
LCVGGFPTHLRQAAFAKATASQGLWRASTPVNHIMSQQSRLKRGEITLIASHLERSAKSWIPEGRFDDGSRTEHFCGDECTRDYRANQSSARQ